MHRPLETRTSGVRDLIDRENKCWNQNLINSTFITIDTIEINKIPLNNLDEEDCLSWKARKNGHYTVKTGYYNIMEWKHTQNEGYFKKDNDK